MVRRNTVWMDQPPTIRARTGVLVVLGMFLAYWGDGVFKAGWALAGLHIDSLEWPRAISAVLQTWGRTALLLAVIVAGLHLVGARQVIPRPRDRAAWRAELLAGQQFLAWLLAGIAVVATVAVLLGERAAYPVADHLLLPDQLVTVLQTVSGPAEEPFFLAFMVAVLRRAGSG